MAIAISVSVPLNVFTSIFPEAGTVAVYHTSASPLPSQETAGIVPAEFVAPVLFPETCVHVELTVREIALQISSLLIPQIVKHPALAMLGV